MTFVDLPSDFVDRPRLERWWINLLVLLRIKSVKTTCCESFRKGKVACKGCATRYDAHSASRWYRFLGRIAKRRPSSTPNVVETPGS